MQVADRCRWAQNWPLCGRRQRPPITGVTTRHTGRTLGGPHPASCDMGGRCELATVGPPPAPVIGGIGDSAQRPIWSLPALARPFPSRPPRSPSIAPYRATTSISSSRSCALFPPPTARMSSYRLIPPPTLSPELSVRQSPMPPVTGAGGSGRPHVHARHAGRTLGGPHPASCAHVWSCRPWALHPRQ